MKKKILARLAMIALLVSMVLTLTGCGEPCVTGCGNNADPKCKAGMCDDCCDFMGAWNSCYGIH